MGRTAGWLLRVGAAVTAVAGLLATGMPAIAHGTTPDPGSTGFVVSTAGRTPSARSLDAALTGAADVTAVRSLGRRLAVVTVRGRLAGARAHAVSSALTATPAITAAAPDSRFTLQGAASPSTVADPFFPSQWDLWDTAATGRAGGYGVDAARAWRRTTGSASVVVAVLDTGITTHPDLKGVHLAPGYDFVTGGNGVGTGDGDGWDADPSDPGDACTADPADPDSSWHGTFVTGEIAARHDGWGVAGEAPGVTIEPVRVLGSCGGTESDTIAAIRWAIGAAVPGVPDGERNTRPANVITMSLGGPGPCDTAMQSAIDEAYTAGVTVVAAAGNDDEAIALDAPADCAHVVSVAATTRAGNRAAYSNRGTSALSPTIAAPGGTEADPVWGDSWTSTGAFTRPSNRPAVTWSIGTSMAAPRVAAAAALLLSVHPGLSPDAVTARLRSSSTHFPGSSTCTALKCGAGIVNTGDLVGATKRFVHATRARISGTAKVGHRLRASAGTWHPGGRVAYRWYRNGRPIAGATHTTYRLTHRDRGAHITVRVTLTRTGYVSASARSAARRIA